MGKARELLATGTLILGGFAGCEAADPAPDPTQANACAGNAIFQPAGEGGADSYTLTVPDTMPKPADSYGCIEGRRGSGDQTEKVTLEVGATVLVVCLTERPLEVQAMANNSPVRISPANPQDLASVPRC